MKRAMLLIGLALLPAPALANDGFGGLTATGLQLLHSDSVRMVSEDLFISPSQIRVASVFRNDGPADVRGEVIFPLPPIPLAGLVDSGFALSEERLQHDNVVGFTARVDGTVVEVRSERIAVREPPADGHRPPSAGYDRPGEEVTAQLEGLGVPLSLDVTEVATALGRLPPDDREALRAGGLVELYDGEPPIPTWSIVVRYHWPQTFAVGRDVTIEHSYDPAPPGGVFVWPEQGADLDPYQQELTLTYCIDAATRRALSRLLHGGTGVDLEGSGTAVFLDYVLATANTWRGPIGRFRLTVDKGDASNVLSLCLDGIRKTGPTTFVVEKESFTPARDLRLLIVSTGGG